VAGIGLAMLSACVRKPGSAAAQSAPDTLPPVMVYKSFGCGCCEEWAGHLRKAGFTVQVQEMEDLAPTRQRVGVPSSRISCHTAEVGGYFLEGHVPAQDAQRLLRERPAAKGLAVPGMPLGSPGMEVPGQSQAYDVFLVAADGSATVFAHYAAMQANAEPGNATVHRATGRITALDAGKGVITLAHEPVPSLQWPAMTMPFRINAELARGLATGQRVEFEFTANGMNAEVTKIRTVSKADGA